MAAAARRGLAFEGARLAPPRRPRGRPEQEIQRAVVDYLRLALPGALVFAVPNNERRPVPGMYKGMTDLVVVFDYWCAAEHAEVRRIGFIEVKAPGRDLRPEQATFRDECRGRALLWACVRSVEGAEVALRSWGIEPRATAGGGR